jgi:hypothetical protein
MQRGKLMLVILVGLLLMSALSLTAPMAQEDEYNLGATDVFGNLRRPMVKFSHAVHSDSLVEEGCGVCHHSRDEKTGELVYIEGEELSCKECHDARKENHKPALREAFHGSCTDCHRDMIKSDRYDTGPTTCGGCHKKTGNDESK